MPLGDPIQSCAASNDSFNVSPSEVPSNSILDLWRNLSESTESQIVAHIGMNEPMDNNPIAALDHSQCAFNTIEPRQNLQVESDDVLRPEDFNAQIQRDKRIFP